MSIETIHGSEYISGDEVPTIDGDYIRGVLVLGRESKNPWNATTTSGGDPKGPRRKFNRILSASEEIAKLAGKAFILHKAAPRDDNDYIGDFENPRESMLGARADLKCRKINGSENFHPQAAALRDNIDKRRPFGGFSPRFDFTIDPSTGEVQSILACESIDLVPQPASVRSAVEEDSSQYVTREEHAKLEERVRGCEMVMAKREGNESHIRTQSIPEVQKPPAITAKNFSEFIRS